MMATWTWAKAHEVNPWLFPSVMELSEDRGRIGLLLRTIPEELRRDADRCPDPWRELSTARLLAVGGYSELFTACASVLPASLQLSRKVYTRGNWAKRARRATTEAAGDAAIRNLFPAMWRAGAATLRDEAARQGPAIMREFEKREAVLLGMMAKKKGKAATAIRPGEPTAHLLRSKHALAYLMVTGWVRCGPLGDPGLCFYSDNALADLFSLLDWRRFDVAAADLNSEQIEQMRGRLGLRKATEKLPLVTSARLNDKTNLIELNTLDAKVAKHEWPKPAQPLRCRVELCGQVLYSGTLF